MKKKNTKHKKIKRLCSRSNDLKKKQQDPVLGWGFIKEIEDSKQSSKNISLVFDKKKFGSLTQVSSIKLLKIMTLSIGLKTNQSAHAQEGDMYGDGGGGDGGDGGGGDGGSGDWYGDGSSCGGCDGYF